MKIMLLSYSLIEIPQQLIFIICVTYLPYKALHCVRVLNACVAWWLDDGQYLCAKMLHKVANMEIIKKINSIRLWRQIQARRSYQTNVLNLSVYFPSCDQNWAKRSYLPISARSGAFYVRFVEQIAGASVLLFQKKLLYGQQTETCTCVIYFPLQVHFSPSVM